MSAVYYNENDPYAAAWLGNLFPDAVIDQRSIHDIHPAELMGRRRCHFFAGIGGWEIALHLAGWPVDLPVWTGSCPCQPYSAAGKQKGDADERNLWPVWFPLIRERRPECVFGEQVASAIRHGWLDGVFADLEGEGYTCGAAVLGAHSVGAPHIRQRLYWVAYAERGAAEPERLDVGGAPGAPQGGAQERERLRSDARDGGHTGGPAHATDPDGRPGERRAEAGIGSDREWGWRLAGGGLAGGLADTDGWQPGDRDLQRSGEHGLEPQDGGADRVADALLTRWAEGRTGPRIGSAPWCGVTLLCEDGRYRRVPATEAATIEPALFPLAYGVSARMGKLRASGNAIVPQQAAAFVRAFMETVRVTPAVVGRAAHGETT